MCKLLHTSNNCISSLTNIQVMSSTVANALTYDDNEDTTETKLFVRLFDEFFDCLNVWSTLEGRLKRKPARLPYYSPNDDRFKVPKTEIIFIG